MIEKNDVKDIRYLSKRLVSDIFIFFHELCDEFGSHLLAVLGLHQGLNDVFEEPRPDTAVCSRNVCNVFLHEAHAQGQGRNLVF